MHQYCLALLHQHLSHRDSSTFLQLPSSWASLCSRFPFQVDTAQVSFFLSSERHFYEIMINTIVAVPVLSNSTVSGPAVNGSILGGLAYPSLYNNLTLEFLEIDIYGRTADGYSFYVHESGVQPGAKKGFSRLVSNMNNQSAISYLY